MSTNEPDEALERLVDRTLRDLPLRRAPLTLESRVFGELQRRAALSWWRRSFAHWPLLARTAFLVACGALVSLAFVSGAPAIAGVRSLPWARDVGNLMVSAASLAAMLANVAPPTWLDEGIALCAVLYAILFGLGATTYRTLYLHSMADDCIEYLAKK